MNRSPVRFRQAAPQVKDRNAPPSTFGERGVCVQHVFIRPIPGAHCPHGLELYFAHQRAVQMVHGVVVEFRFSN